MSEPAAATCTSCGDAGVLLERVHRIYLTWPEDGGPAVERVVDEPELWCAVCRTQYPHEVR
ncbi:MAG: hypothetical protein JWN46_3531 [Acidimicrobiales bacterium]|nr:hypothetical protein [Acidimicrobiales bacterium]